MDAPNAQVVLQRAQCDTRFFRRDAVLPYNLTVDNFAATMNEVYDFMHDVNTAMVSKGWQRLEDFLDTAAISGMLSSILGYSLASKSRQLIVNACHNGHPDLLPTGIYPNNACHNAEEGVEVKATVNDNGAVDMHGARPAWLCTFVYNFDKNPATPLSQRKPLSFSQIFLAKVELGDFRKNERGELGTRTATLSASGLAKYRPEGWLFLDEESRQKTWFRKWEKEQAGNSR
uniref:Restriction endonuclease n=1 Tax=Muribaculaceae bacterium Z82 TaxID=2304548 RepID=A0A7C9JEV0_9BACT